MLPQTKYKICTGKALMLPELFPYKAVDVICKAPVK